MIWNTDNIAAEWPLVDLASLASKVGSGATPKGGRSSYLEQGTPFIRSQNVRFEGFTAKGLAFLSDAQARLLGNATVRAGDVLLNITGASIGRVCVAPASMDGARVNQHVCIIRSTKIAPEFLAAYISSPQVQNAVSLGNYGVTREALTKSQILELPVPLPPEMIRSALVKFVHDISVRRSNALSHIDMARKVIERFRHAVLAAACSGRLTADWRGNRDSNPWVRTTVGEIGNVQLGGTPSRKKAEYWNGDIAWVSSGEVANCRISATREAISQHGLNNSNAKVYPVGTVLIAMIGEGKTRGQSAILDIEACTNQNVAGILPDPSTISGEYLWRWALAQYETTRAVGRGGNQPALNSRKIRELAIGVPPLEEQAEIIRRLDQLLQLADSLASRVDAARILINQTSRAVLAKVFRGDWMADVI